MKVYVVIDNCIDVESIRDKHFYIYSTFEMAKRKVVELFEKAIKDVNISDKIEVDEFGWTKTKDGKDFCISLIEDEGYANICDEYIFNEYISIEEREII